MSTDEERKKTVCAALSSSLGEKGLSAIDDSVLDYVSSILSDPKLLGNDVDALTDAVAPFLVDTGALPTRDSARDLVTLVTGLSSTSAAASLHTLTRLAAPVTIALQSQSDDPNANWVDYIRKTENPTYVNVEALKKVEEKQKERSEKRAAKEQARADKKRERAGLTFDASGPTSAGFEVSQTQGEQGSACCRDVHIENITVNFGKLELLSGATLALNAGRRYGLVGRNGCGKSTLLRHIARREELPISRSLRILHVEQEVIGDDTPVLEAVLLVDVERTELLEQEKRLLVANPSSEKLQKIYQRMGEIDIYNAEARASQILTGLSFSEEMKKKPTKTFSGGWRMRVALARALYLNPDILLLDEPTNHLDFHAVVWLESFLTNESYSGNKILVLVSHQREFLNNVATDIVHLRNRKLEYYHGDYDTFERVANDRIKQQKAEFDSQMIQRKHVERFIERFRYNAKRASLVQSRLKMLEKQPLVSAVVEEGAVVLPFIDPTDPVSPPIMQFSTVSFRYPSKQDGTAGPSEWIFNDVSFGIDCDSRIALVGANGTGKTTLLKLLTGDLQPTKGHVLRSGKVRIGHFSQHFVDQLDLNMTAVEWMTKQFPPLTVQEARAHLGRYGITGDTGLQMLNTLSGGQKSRVVFAQIAFRKPHMLLLDEPSNHLDIETIEGLAQSLTTYQGGVVMVSHDQRLISLVCDEVWQMVGNSVKRWNGDVLSYKKSLESSIRPSLK